MIIDCHVHLPSPSLGVAVEWAPFTPDVKSAIAYLKRCGVERAICAFFRATEARTPEEMRAGNDETMEIARTYPEMVIPGCCINPNFPEEAVAELRRCREAGIVWLHELVGYIADYTYDTEGFARVVRAAAKLGMVVQIHSEGTEMDRICSELPEVTWVLAHIGDSRDECRARCELAVKHPNLYLDVCGHGIQRMGVLDLAVKCAGPERVLFGSDYTVNDPAAVLATIQASYLEEGVKEMVLGGSVTRMLGERGVRV